MPCGVGWLKVQKLREPSKNSRTSSSGQNKATHVIMTKLSTADTEFIKDIHCLVSVMEEFGNIFEEESADLVVLDTKEIAGPTAVETVRNAKRIGQEQFLASLTKECLVERSKPLDNAIHHNKLKVFCSSKLRSVSKGKQQTVSLKHDLGPERIPEGLHTTGPPCSTFHHCTRQTVIVL